MEDNKRFKNLLLEQYEMYPKMQIQDMVKFIYQNEFAGGHMIENEEASLNLLEQEIQNIYGHLASNGIPLDFQSIGNGLSRLYLKGSEKGKRISPETINKFFVNTANRVRGEMGNFEEKLDILRLCCRDGLIPYSADKLEAYIKDYRERGYPPVSHSFEYRAAYSPAYRIVMDEYRHYFSIFSELDNLLKSRKAANAAIDGNSGSGKSTLSNLIKNVYDCNVFHMDDFFLRPEQRTPQRLSEVGGNVDYIRFKEEIMEGIPREEGFEYRPYSCKTLDFEEPISVKPKKLNIIEGVYSMHPTLIHSYDFKIFLHIDKGDQSQRILKRNGPHMHKRFVEEWIPMENEYFEKEDIPGKSNIVIQGYSWNGI